MIKSQFYYFSMPQTLVVGHVNIFHIEPKLHDVFTLLKTHKLDFLGITETRLSPYKHSSDILRIPHYSFIRKDANIAGHTGIGVYIHENIIDNIHRRHDLESKTIESIWLEIRSSTSIPTLIGFIYRNPASLVNWNDDFVAMIDSVNSCNLNTLILGDFNTDLLVSQPIWENMTNMLGFKQLIKEPTRITAKSSTLLDHIYTNNQKISLQAFTSDTCMSDHKPIYCKWSFKLPKCNPKGHTYITYRNFKKFDINAYQQDLGLLNFDNVFRSSEPNQAADLFFSTFLSVINKHAPVCKKRVKHPTIPNWMTSEIRDAMKIRDQFKKNKQFAEYKHQRNRVTELVRSAKKNHFEKLLNQPNTTQTSQVWKAMNEFSNKSRKLPDSNTNKFSAKDYNDHFISITKSIVDSMGSSNKYEPSEHLKQFCKTNVDMNTSFVIPSLSVEKVYSIISKLNNKKSMDLSYLNSCILKMSLPFIVEVLTFLYNMCIEKNIFPSIFKQARVTPLPKSTDLSDIDNYRPISILSILAKPLEKHIHENLMKYLEENKLLYNFQSGFRAGHSCHSALTRLHDTWLNAINNKYMVGAVFLDMRKAFDLVNHDILLQKLNLYFQNDSTVSFFLSYLSQRQQTVYSNGSFSVLKDITHGVPQGSVLGPVLFCLYINDLPFSLSQPDAILDLFADDSSLHTQNKNLESIQNTLQKSINEIDIWCKSNKMALHPKKTKAMLLSTRQKHQLHPLKLELNINSTPVEQVSEHRVLGVIFDEKLSWHSHIDNMCKTISRNLYLMSRLKKFVSLNALKLFFHGHILSHINYASNIWCNASQIQIKRLDSLHKRAIKILSTNKDLTKVEKYINLQLLPFSEQLVYNGCILMYKIYYDMAPNYLNSFFHKARAENRCLLYILPLPRIDLYKSSLAFWGAKIWNNLPTHYKKSISLTSFKFNLRNHLFSIMLMSNQSS